MSYKQINTELCDQVKVQAAKISVMESRKVTDTEVIERYIKEGISRDKKKRYIKK